MIPRGLIALLGLVAACVTTPLPLPPTMDPERISLEQGDEQTVIVRGAAGAASPGGIELRVTPVESPPLSAPPEFGEVRVEEDGSFEVVVFGEIVDTFYFEALEEDEDIFLIAVTGAYGGVAEVDAGPDRDGDGSPDPIDCAPDDDRFSGHRCP